MLIYSIIACAIVLCVIITILTVKQVKKGKYSYAKIISIHLACIGFIAGLALVVILRITPGPTVSLLESLFLIGFFTILGFVSGYGHARAREVVQSKIKRIRRK